MKYSITVQPTVMDSNEVVREIILTTTATVGDLSYSHQFFLSAYKINGVHMISRRELNNAMTSSCKHISAWHDEIAVPIKCKSYIESAISFALLSDCGVSVAD